MTGYGRIAGAALLLATAAGHVPAHAQTEIVQPLPPPGSDQLADALSRLARNSQDVSALLDAGDAALLVGDIGAAIGFFGRANELSPGDSRIKVGLARAYVRSQRPIEALRLFAEAERAGVDNSRMAEERGLAFDLVGDSASAQQLYRLALGRGAGPEIVRRLALSLAISGDRDGFEQTLLPLLEKGDVSAFRTRAFGLAILGDTAAATEISDTMLNPQMAQQMRSYLEYLPRLTQAQQAAAGNLGVFPRAASMGTDEPRIAGYDAAKSGIARPTGRQPSSRERSRSARSEQARPSRATPVSSPPSQRQPSARPAEPVQGPVEPTQRPGVIPDVASVPSPPQSSARPEPVQRPGVIPETSPATPPPPPPPSPGPTREASAPAAAVVVARESDSAVRSAPRQIVLPPPEPESATPPPAPAPAPAPTPASVADAFENFTLAQPAPATTGANAVDITRIDIPRERAKPKPPPPPAHPARHWVQVATGKDRDALAFDWRRIARKADGRLDGKGPFVTPWVEANRLLAGPYDSEAEARKMVNELKELGLDSFPFSSAEGEEIERLD